jgi:hypothetical protein
MPLVCLPTGLFEHPETDRDDEARLLGDRQKTPGEIMPLVGWSQRISASTATIRRSLSSTIGW